jgi:hypothetical protein
MPPCLKPCQFGIDFDRFKKAGELPDLPPMNPNDALESRAIASS